ncbi:MAG: GNAT family N-acetyltransferase [Microcoleus sp.]
MNLEQSISHRFQIRGASLDDTHQICDVCVNAVRALAANDCTPAQIKAWVGDLTPENYRAAMQERGEVIFVAFQKDRIVGFSSLLGNEVRAVYVHPDCTRQGIGSTLLNAVEREAKCQGINKLQTIAPLTVVLFYQAHSYQILTKSTFPLTDGIDIPCLKMEKRLFN